MFPVKRLVVVMRTTLTVRPGSVAAGPTIAAVFYETISLVASGAVLATCVLLTTVERDPTKAWELLTHFDMRSSGAAGSDPKLLLLALAVSFATVIPTIPAVFRWLLRRLKKFNIRSKADKSSAPDQLAEEVDLAEQATTKSSTFRPVWSPKVGLDSSSVGF